jgi:RNA polymerase sigma-70 factor, ECF subfamily
MAKALGTREVNEALLLAAARQGDHEAFTSLTEPYRPELLVYGYRLLGSFQDAEDLIQETLLRAWTRLASFAGRSTFRAWLYKIATNTGLNVLAHASRRSLPMQASSPPDPADAPSYEAPDAEPLWLEPILESYVDAGVTSSPEAVYSLRESVSLAFMVALHALPPHQRATLILRDVLDWHAAEVAEFLDMSVPAVNSALQRARATLARQYHPIGLDAIETPTLTPALQTLLSRYMQAWATNNVDALISLLKEDATFAMPPQSAWYDGRDAIRQFFQASVFTTVRAPEWRLELTATNAQPACVLYRFNQSIGAFAYFGLLVLTIDGSQVASTTAFIDPALGERFGFRLELPPSSGSDLGKS